MAQKTVMEAKGLYTDPNLLSKVPEGALVIADNVVIDRDAVIEPRRGFNQYGNEFGIGSDRTKQLLTYKNRILIHYNDKLLFNANPHNNTDNGNFQEFDGSYTETESGLRLKFIEANRNLYFTTEEGIKKISARTAQDFTSAPNFIIDAGAISALDVTGRLNSFSSGFLPGNSKVAYRVVWGYKDRNDVLLLGSPSSRTVITNFSEVSANVDLEFVIPSDYNDNYFYQVYRTAVFTASQALTLDDIDPGDEMNLVFEGFPTSAQKTAQLITLTDISPEDFRQGGTPLYTNPNSGEGILQSNDAPPKSKDLTLYQNSTFYANNELKASLDLSLLGVGTLTSGVSTIQINDGINPAEIYTFVGTKEETLVDFTNYTGSIPVDLDGKYWLLNSASNIRKYYIWYDNTKTTQTLDFSQYIGTPIPGDLDGDFVVFYTATDRAYYIWFDATGTTQDPANLVQNSDLVGKISVKVDIQSATDLADICQLINDELVLNNIFDDYDVVYTPSDEFIQIETESFENLDFPAFESIGKGFVYTSTSQPRLDPANSPDTESKVGIRVNISRNVTDVIELADATAAALFEQDNAQDFEINYSTGDSFFTIENTNNGATDDAADSSINGLDDGFNIVVTTQGTGEDSATNSVLLSAAATPAQRIDETTRSLVNIINKNTSSIVTAIYLSSTNDLPGQFLLRAKKITTESFFVEADSAATGELFNPSLPPAPDSSPVEANKETRPNRIYFSKIQQPESVPSVNFIDVGPRDKEISRILALRESLFILKEDGIYRLTGIGGNFTVDLFDESTRIIAPDSAVVLNNMIYCLTNQGIARISDTGVEIISKRLDNILQVITSSNYNFRLTSFGVSYETDRSYILWVPSTINDNVATQAFRYNIADDAFTRWPVSKICGAVNLGDNKLYLGPADENFIERERKNFKRTDYADREFNLSIPPLSVNNSTVTLSEPNIAEIGDALVQTQFLTINQFNQLLTKLDLDPFTGSPEEFTVDFTGYTGNINSDLHGKYFIIYSASDAQKYTVFYDAFNNLDAINPVQFPEVLNSTQIRVNVSGLPSLADVVNQTQNTIKTVTQDFVITYVTSDLFFNAVTVRNGETTDANDGVANGIGQGFAINTTTQGFGDYLSNLRVNPGDNLRDKLNELAIKLDQDPAVNDTDYLVSINAFNSSFVECQQAFNVIVNKLNLDTGVFYSNYLLSDGSVEYETLIFGAEPNISVVETQFSLGFVEGPVVVFKGIKAKVQYAPETFGDASMSKHIREGTIMFENSTFTRGELGYKTDLSPGIENVQFTKSGNGDWGTFIWSGQNWGGGFSGIPFRTYIPRNKQRCRYIQAQYDHDSAREKWAIFGISYTFEATSERAYRDS
jgi:hypothetical protein